MGCVAMRLRSAALQGGLDVKNAHLVLVRFWSAQYSSARSALDLRKILYSERAERARFKKNIVLGARSIYRGATMPSHAARSDAYCARLPRRAYMYYVVGPVIHL